MSGPRIQPPACLRRRPGWRAGVLTCLVALPGWSESSAAGRTDLLATPVPREQLRDLNTDRPDKTESPYTVDAGHFQLEMDVVSYATDHDESGRGDVQTQAYAIAPFNLKFGLGRNVDLQVVVETYNHVRVEDRITGLVDSRSGCGDITARLKFNCWGNDAGQTAFGVMPFLKLPTNQHGIGNNSVEGGVILPLAVALPGGWGMGWMTELDVLRNPADNGYGVSVINSITFSHDIAGRLGGYVELFSEVRAADDSDWVGTLDLGLVYGLSGGVQFDTGINIGLTDSAVDLNPFLGISRGF